MFSTLRGVCLSGGNFNVRIKKSFVFCCVSAPTTRSLIKTIPRPKLAIKKFEKHRNNIPAKIGDILKRDFHTTKRRDIPPILALLLRPALRVGSFLFGRTIRRWWAKKSPSERERYAAWFRSKKPYFYGIFGGSLTVLLIYYFTHFENTPITNRRRFIMFSEQQQAAFGKLVFQMHVEEHKDKIVPANQPIYRELQLLTNHLINANQDIEMLKGKNWTLTVVDDPSGNAFVLPGGNIFIFTGILHTVENLDQLLFVISHEIAHVLLKHSMETISNAFLIDALLVVPIVIISALFPDVAAALLQFMGHIVISVLHDLPYHRAQETEADEVGLILAAKACVDVREAVVFWGLMRAGEELHKGYDDDIPWLSTHPNHKDREKNLDRKINEAIALRNKSQCPILHPADPRKKFNEQSPKELEWRLNHRGVFQ